MKSKKISDLWRIRVTTNKTDSNYNRTVYLYRKGQSKPIYGFNIRYDLTDAEIVSMVKERIYKYKNTWLVFSFQDNEPLRWQGDNTLFFAGSKSDAMLNLSTELFYAHTVLACMNEKVVKEYEQRIDACYLSGELEF